MTVDLSTYLKDFNVRIGKKEVIVTPEFFLTGFPPQIKYAKEDVEKLVKTSELPIFFGFAESANSFVYSSYIGKINGEMIHARKMQAYKKTERRCISDGMEELRVWKTTLGKFSILLCYDAYRVAKEPSKYFNQPVDVILVPSFWKLCHSVLLEKCNILSRELECIVINSDYYNGVVSFMNGDVTCSHRSNPPMFFKCVYCKKEAVDYCWNCGQELCIHHISYINEKDRIGFCPVCQNLNRI